jgi:hypothetical protein
VDWLRLQSPPRRSRWPRFRALARKTSTWTGAFAVFGSGGRFVRRVGSCPIRGTPIAGDYEARDGWIRLHTNALHHRAAALRVLGTPEERDAVITAVAQWEANELEGAVVEAGGCAAAMRSLEEWAHYPQGQTIARAGVSFGRIHPGRPAEAAAPERYSRGKKRITAAPASATPE